MRGKIPETYEIIEQRFSKDLNSELVLLSHKKTKARVALISNDDDNKTFYIGFRTPVSDSTGVPHILEHSVLCGSDKYPIKDPFVELAKGSLNTFLNAMTFPDKTVYPVASCNDKDFQNLMDVYLDAVFHPNIYKHPEIFKQEGWRFEMKSEDSELTYNGVVYSEMKGVFSSAEDVMERQIMNYVFPDVTYGKESGGDPDVIPELTYEKFLEFHGKLYHPSNSYIYLYGDMDMGEKLDYIDKEYLSKYDYLYVDSEIGLQKPIEAPVEKNVYLPVTDEDEEEEGTYLTYNVLMDENSDKLLYQAIKILDYAICSAPGAPLKQALIDKGIGRDVYSEYENGVRQMYFSIIAKDANESDKEEFLSTIREVLTDVVKNGFEEKSLRAAISRMEFQYRESDFGSYPKGLVYGLAMLDSWLYDDSKAFWHVEADETFKLLKEKVGTGYYEELVNKYLLNNPHTAIVIGIPKAGLALKKDEERKAKLAEIRAGLSEEQIKQIVEDTKALKIYQETPDSEEDLMCIPLLNREDLRKEIIPFTIDVDESRGYKVISHDIFTNGIAYVTVSFDVGRLTKEEYAYLGLLKICLGLMDTEHYSYKELYREVDLYTGMIAADLIAYEAMGEKDPKLSLDVKMKVLYENIGKGFELMKDILFTTKLEDEKRLLELIKEYRSRYESMAVSSGHSIALGRLVGYLCEKGAVSEAITGIDFVRFLQDADDHFEEKKGSIIVGMKNVLLKVLRAENATLSYISPKDADLGIVDEYDKLRQEAFRGNPVVDAEPLAFEKKNEGFITAGDVQYVAKGGFADTEKTPYHGALKVLRTILGYDYLWINVRVKGGAYGCMSRFGYTGFCGFVSYRDPNLKGTLDIYDNIPAFLAGFDANERTMTKFIIGTLSGMDTPLTPSTAGARSYNAYRSNITEEFLQKERDQVLNATAEDIRSLAAYVESALSADAICVVGSESVLKEGSDIFANLTNLI